MKNLFLIISLIALSGCSIVGPQSRGVRLVGGAATEQLTPGMHLWFPVLYGLEEVDVSIQKNEVVTEAASRDMQSVHVTLAVNWSVSPDQVVNVYKTLGNTREVLNKIIVPAVSEVLKATTTKRTAEEILSQRMALKDEIDKAFKSRVETYGLKLYEVSIVHLTFSEGFTAAIEAKQVAEQHSQQAKYLAEKAINDAQAAINTAKGQAEAQRLVQTTLTPAILQQQAILKWDGHFPQMMGGNGALPFVNFNAK